MVLLLGGSGYVGSAFQANLRALREEFVAPDRQQVDAASKESLAAAIRHLQPKFVVNAIGFTGRPNIDSTEREKLRCLQANMTVPGVIAEVLADAGIPWGHVSSGCIYQGVRTDGQPFTEDDAPNFAFAPEANWYSRTKAMAEILLRDFPNCTIWRLRIPFDQYDHERNYISKVMRYDRLLETTNSISQLQEFAAVSLQTLLRGLPGGIYNVVNPGVIKTSEIAAGILRHRLSVKEFQFFDTETEFLSTPGRVRRASCVLSSEKLAAHGLPLREIHEALEWTLRHWEGPQP